jgi:hypothetical protein
VHRVHPVRRETLQETHGDHHLPRPDPKKKTTTKK